MLLFLNVVVVYYSFTTKIDTHLVVRPDCVSIESCRFKSPRLALQSSFQIGYLKDRGSIYLFIHT